MKNIECLNIEDLVVYNNPNGTLSAYSISPSTGEYVPYPLIKPCCEKIGGTFDIITQRCFKDDIISGCDYSQSLNLVLNPVGNSWAIFSDVVDETCTLEVQFDYLLKFDCNKLTQFLNGDTESTCTSLDAIFENIGASMAIEKITPSQFGSTSTTVYQQEFFTPIGNGNLLSYLQDNSGLTGFYICIPSEQSEGCNDLDFRDDIFLPRSACFEFAEQILIDYPTIPYNAFASDWVTFNTEITDPSVLSAITDERIKLVIKLSGFCIDMCVLVDNIKLNRKCTKSLRDEIFVSKSPSFDLDRIIDNKKSWVKTTETTRRKFSITSPDGTKPIRYTDYYLDDERQVLNTKEIDLDIDIASAIETDTWCYISDNPCLLTGVTIGTTTCVKDAYTVVTGTTIVTTTTDVDSVIYTSCTITATSSTTITYPGTTAYTCSVGFSATPANDRCESILVQSATTPTNLGPIITAGDNNGEDYGISGTYFYPEVTNISASNPLLPYRYRSFDGELEDNTFNVVTPLAINNSNGFWASLGSPLNGRLNNAGIRAPLNSWAGFTQCIDILSAGTYYVGIAADNQARFYVNGVLIADFNTDIQPNFRKWSVFPIRFNSGVNIIEMQGLDSGVDSSFAAEIYYPTDFATLTGATNTGTTGLIFSTIQRVGTRFDTGDNIGYSCPSGYILSNCDNPVCIRIQKEPISVVVTEPQVVVSSTTYTSTTTCPVYTSITITETATTITAATVCLPKTYCCSEYCGDANIDIQRLFTEPLSGVTTIEDFKYYTTSQLIDAKNRQTITSYATLRMLYDRYMNSLEFCGTKSSMFDYFKMTQFADLVGNYWVDLIEQVMPSTTMWGSTRIYTNTMFDTQKFKYKAYTTQFGTPNFIKVLSPATGATCGVDAVTSVITGSTSSLPQYNEQTYPIIYTTQMNSGSEFIGKVMILSQKVSPCSEDELIGCDLEVRIEYNQAGDLIAIPSNFFGEVSYEWVTPNGEFTSETVTPSINGMYMVTIKDTCCTASAMLNVGIVDDDILETPIELA